MKPRHAFVLLVMALLLFPGQQTFAEQPVTFEILATFEYPGAITTQVTGINDQGDVSGYFLDQSNSWRGYVRFTDGSFSPSIKHPNDTGRTTIVEGLNNLGTLCGNYLGLDGRYHGFLLTDSTYTDVDVGAGNTYVEAINDAGNFCGRIDTGGNEAQGFVISTGRYTTFTIGGEAFTFAFGINNLDRIAGTTATLDRLNGFRRDVDGTINWPIRSPKFTIVYVFGIDDKGRMAGQARVPMGPRETLTHGIFFRSPHQFALFDYPGASDYTAFFGMNNRGQVCGIYDDDVHDGHPFIVQVRLDGDE